MACAPSGSLIYIQRHDREPTEETTVISQPLTSPHYAPPYTQRRHPNGEPVGTGPRSGHVCSQPLHEGEFRYVEPPPTHTQTHAYYVVNANTEPLNLTSWFGTQLARTRTCQTLLSVAMRSGSSELDETEVEAHVFREFLKYVLRSKSVLAR